MADTTNVEASNFNLKMSQLELNRTNIQVDEANKKIGKPGGVKTELDRDAFFKLLVTQLSHQDPMNPMEDREFISQMAQFSSLDYMKNMSHEIGNFIRSSESSLAFSFLGNHVEAVDPVTQKPVSGEVSSVFFEGGKAFLRVNDRTVNVGDVSVVYKAGEK